ncbi:hypothetical protein ATANTOWER_016483 [Ataeniobius toweri]|uniref:Uncharacterized protein n=1 Tax=Ataeniobius toweri TaxID=208326 RepID=A0ABU7AY71_9TELE|nr:hypothetical protein [Ataeniobius toweri]
MCDLSPFYDVLIIAQDSTCITHTHTHTHSHTLCTRLHPSVARGGERHVPACSCRRSSLIEPEQRERPGLYVDLDAAAAAELCVDSHRPTDNSDGSLTCLTVDLRVSTWGLVVGVFLRVSRCIGAALRSWVSTAP